MGLFDFLTGKHLDEQTEEEQDEGATLMEEDTSDACDYDKGVKFARKQIDWSRKHYQERGYSSFQESVNIGGQIWHRIVEQEETNIEKGWTERQGQLDYSRGARSQYD